MNIIEFLENEHNIILNEQQQKGVLCIDKNTLLLAVPGSGKTTVLVSRIANLIINYKVNPTNMLTLTYSKETAKDMKRRYNSLFSSLDEAQPEFRTIHSFCLLVLKLFANSYNRQLPRLISDGKISGLKQRVLREIYMKHNQEYLTDDVMETLDKLISFSKNMMLTKEQMENLDKQVSNFYSIFNDYESYKKKNKLIDYDDMLTYTYHIFTKFPKILEFFQQKYNYINIDEAQDTSLIQHNIIKLLASKSLVFMVGDEDQSIYSFRGAYPQALLNFNSLYTDAQIIKMEQNFRSNMDIVKKANEFIKQNKQRYEKEMYCDNKNKSSIQVKNLTDYREQYNFILDYIKGYPKNKTLAIIYRNNESAIPLVDLMYQNNINFYIKEHKITYFSSFVVKDIIAYINLSLNPCDIESFKQIYYKIGLSKLAFLFVERNLYKYNSVFECAAEITSLSDFKRNQMKFYKSAFKRLIKMKPKKAIDYIQDELGYQYYLQNRLNDGFTKTNAFQKLNVAICLAQNVDTIYDYLDKLDYLQNSFKAFKNIDKKSNIVFTTLHSSKGLEFDTVIMLDMIKDIIPTSEAVNNQLLGELSEIENEVRLFYVGVTRAKQKLIMFKSNRLNDCYTTPSRFIDRYVNGNPLIRSNKLNNQSKNKIVIENFVGKEINHDIFGEGIIESQDNDILTVIFKKVGTKSISYQACMKVNLIEIK